MIEDEKADCFGDGEEDQTEGKLRQRQKSD